MSGVIVSIEQIGAVGVSCPANSGQSFLEGGSVADGVMLLLELERRQVVQAAVGSDGVEVTPPGLDDDLGFGARSEPLDAQALVWRKRPLKLSLVPFCHGLPGSISAVAMPLSAIHSRIARLTNSGPLSERRKSGAPCVLSETRQHLDHALGADRAGHVDGQAFVGELVDDRQDLIWRPSAVASKTKS